MHDASNNRRGAGRWAAAAAASTAHAAGRRPAREAARAPQVTYSARAAVLLHAAPLLAAAALLRGARGVRAGALAAHAALYFAGVAYAMAAPAALGALLVVITGALHRSRAQRQRLAHCWNEVWFFVLWTETVTLHRLPAALLGPASAHAPAAPAARRPPAGQGLPLLGRAGLSGGPGGRQADELGRARRRGVRALRARGARGRARAAAAGARAAAPRAARRVAACTLAARQRGGRGVRRGGGRGGAGRRRPGQRLRVCGVGRGRARQPARAAQGAPPLALCRDLGYASGWRLSAEQGA